MSIVTDIKIKPAITVNAAGNPVLSLEFVGIDPSNTLALSALGQALEMAASAGFSLTADLGLAFSLANVAAQFATALQK